MTAEEAADRLARLQTLLTEQQTAFQQTMVGRTLPVLIEKPGHKPVDVVAGSLASFIDSLVPAPPELHPERALPG